MIDPKNMPIDVEEIRAWLIGYRENRPEALSWSVLAKESGVPMGTLQPFAKGNYAGNNENVARKLFMFRQAVEAKEKRQESLPEDPGFIETETAKRLQGVLTMAHFGRITIAATGPGTGKTKTIEDYCAKAQPTWVATMRPSTSSLNQMIMQVHKALGIEPRNMSSAAASQIVVEKVKDRKGLLVIDEANYLTIEAIEEVRSWHDETGVGICLMGNEELLQRIETGRHSDQLSRLNRRIAMRHVQRVPLREDVDAFCDAWGIHQHDIRHYLTQIALTPAAGGLGECQQLIEAASMMAAEDGEDRGITMTDLQYAQSMRQTRWIKAA